jgi:tetratricopeptide (TPR) repeat protein
MSSKTTLSLAELEANHWQEAGQMRRSALACFRAAEHARARYLNQRAVELYKRGLELTGGEDRLIRIDVLHDLGSIFELQGKLPEAEWCLTEMLRNSWILGHRNKAGAALNKIGRLYRLRGDGVAARAFLNRAMMLFKAGSDERGVAACLGDLGEQARQEGSFDRAYSLVRESFELHRKHKNRRSMAVCLQSLGNIDAARAAYDRAERFFNEALEMRRKINDRAGMAQTLSSLATLMFNRGDTEKAVSRFEAALELSREVGDRRLEAQAYIALGEVSRDRRDYKSSMEHFKAAEEIAKDQKDRMLLSEVSRNLAVLVTRTGNMTLGRKYVNRALDIAKKIGAKEMEALAFRALGELESSTMWDTSKTEGKDEAQEAFETALQIFRTIGNELETARTLHALGNRMLERGAITQSREVLKEARDIFKNIDPKISESIEKTIMETKEHSQTAMLDHVIPKSDAAE